MFSLNNTKIWDWFERTTAVSSNKPFLPMIPQENPLRTLSFLPQMGKYIWSVWRYIFKRRDSSKDCFFDESLCYAEDAEYIISAIKQSGKVVYLGDSLACSITHRNDSLSANKIDPRYATHRILVWSRNSDYFWNVYLNSRDKYARMLAAMYAEWTLNSIVKLAGISAVFCFEANRVLKEKWHLLCRTRRISYMVKNLLYRVAGFDMAPRVIGILKKLRASFLKSL